MPFTYLPLLDGGSMGMVWILKLERHTSLSTSTAMQIDMKGKPFSYYLEAFSMHTHCWFLDVTIHWQAEQLHHRASCMMSTFHFSSHVRSNLARLVPMSDPRISKTIQLASCSASLPNTFFYTYETHILYKHVKKRNDANDAPLGSVA